MADTDSVRQIRAAESLADLSDRFETDSIHEAYFRAKSAWRAADHYDRETVRGPEDFPGRRVEIDGHEFHVHGITHAGTPEERSYLRNHVFRLHDRGAVVYCEQGIRSMYFDDLPEVCEMDDYRWAMNECAALDAESHVDSLPEVGFDALLEDVAAVTSEFRDATFSLIDAGTTLYGGRFERALGDVATAFVTDHADLAVGREYDGFSLSRTASRNPERLVDLQQYYRRTFLPQPLEREWLRRHDPELEIGSHARNERMADYVVYHNETAEEVHLIVGAAHQPGVVYYLERYQEGRALPDQIELF